MPRAQGHARHTPVPRHDESADEPSLRIADDTTTPPLAGTLHARALQQRLAHRFDAGEFELPPAQRYPPAVRLMLLLGATASLWWSLYVLSRVALS